ncbi:hypothetical protein BC463_07800 [Neisseria meningitidis]|nr:hypothetical protein [Neisseria meningitidis]MBQ5160029.1 hypothetical protein [Neisseria meningitidis]MBQ5161925.1 hypothetical protein [Neisseria meningitidis]MBQ5200907.1 hypothetical protein [Neisseria meningitidis]MBR7220441.1 hypothetical protein [Neisseria meningitidis]
MDNVAGSNKKKRWFRAALRQPWREDFNTGRSCSLRNFPPRGNADKNNLHLYLQAMKIFR